MLKIVLWLPIALWKKNLNSSPTSFAKIASHVSCHPPRSCVVQTGDVPHPMPSTFMFLRILSVAPLPGTPFHLSAIGQTLYLLLKIPLACFFLQEALPDLPGLHQRLQLCFHHALYCPH